MADKTQYLELGKPTQEDFYDIEVQNRNMDIIDMEIKNIDEYRNIDTFSSFSELDIRDDGSLTIDDMLVALDNKHSGHNSNAIFVERIDATSLISPNGEAGQIMVFTRLTGAVLLYVADNKHFFYGVTQYSSGGQYKWQGWKELLNTDSGTFTGTLKINSSSPTLEMTDTSNNGGTKIHKNADSDVDYGTYISDIASDGTCDILILRREGSTNADKISLRVQSADGSTYDTYKIYGEHNKPTPADIGAATKEEVQTAQSTADVAKTNAATAQSTADEALNKANKTAIVSYVGTGKSGASYPCSVTFDFVPKVLVLLARHVPEIPNNANLYPPIAYSLVNDDGGNVTILCDKLSTDYASGLGFRVRGGNNYAYSAYAKKSDDGKTIFWYIIDTDASNVQANDSGETYYILAIG